MSLVWHGYNLEKDKIPPKYNNSPHYLFFPSYLNKDCAFKAVFD